MLFVSRGVVRWLLVAATLLTILYLVSSSAQDISRFDANDLFTGSASSSDSSVNSANSAGASNMGIQYNQKLMHNDKPYDAVEYADGLTWPQLKEALTFDKSLLENIEENIVEENMDFFREVYSKRITEPKFAELTYNVFVDKNGRKKVLSKDEYPRANATLLTLVRNQELQDIVYTLRQLEANWNHKFHYPYTFINDEPFTDEFKETIKRHTVSDCYFEVIPAEIWNKPDNIDTEIEAQKMSELKKKGVQYIDKVSYHNMCRFNSGYFYQLERLQQFRYYWRFEPATDYYCNVDYDLFKFMEDNNKTYGFTISLYDNPLTVETLWPTTLEFLEKNPQYAHPNGAFRWLTENVQHPEYVAITGGYSTCHFWSNFEIGDMDFYRGEAYSKWMEALDEAGGFYYERWGDAPVHSVGLGLFEDRSKIHWFRDIGYHHSPYKNIPNSDKCNAPEDSGYFAPEDVYDQNCLSNWIRLEMTNKELQSY
jgi:mannosyltransferase